MATRIETLGTGSRAPRSAWLALVAMVLIATALAVGALIGSNGGTTAPARSRDAGATVVVRDQPAPGLIKGGLQPRPFSPIEVDGPSTGGKAPAGFVRMPSGEVRPVPGS
jgi:hypothetical protein